MAKTVQVENIIKLCESKKWTYVDHIRLPHPDDHYCAYVTSQAEDGTYQNHHYNADVGEFGSFNWGRYMYTDKEVCLEVMRSRIL
jgi:hypothetical protein